MDAITGLLAVLVVWLTHRTLLGISRLIEPSCMNCGGRSWTRDPAGGWACTRCRGLLAAHTEVDQPANAPAERAEPRVAQVA